MAVLSKEDFFSHLQERVGTDSSDDAIRFTEDMMDTYNDLEQRASGDGENWKQKYEDLDKSWKKKYQARFFTSESYTMPHQGNNGPDNPDDTNRPEDVRINDLFN